MKKIKIYIPIITLCFFILVIQFSALGSYFTFDKLKENRIFLLNWVENHPHSAPFVYMGFYTIATALSFPTAGILSIAGGFLFDQPWSTIYTILASTCGATILYHIAKLTLKTQKTKLKSELIKKFIYLLKKMAAITYFF